MVCVEDNVAGRFHPAFTLVHADVKCPASSNCYLVEDLRTFVPSLGELGNSAVSDELPRHVVEFGMSSWRQLNERIIDEF